MKLFLLFILASASLLVSTVSASGLHSVDSPSESLISFSNGHSFPSHFKFDHTDERGSRTSLSYQVEPLEHIYHFNSIDHNLHKIECDETEGEEGTLFIRMKDQSRHFATEQQHEEEEEGEAESTYPDVFPIGTVFVFESDHSNCHSQHDHTGLPLLRKLNQPFTSQLITQTIT